MADYNRNQRGSYRTSNQDWNENRGRNGHSEDDDRNYRNENRGYGNNSGYDESNSGWQSRYEREDYNRGTDSSGGSYGRQYDNDMNSGNYYGSDRGYGNTSYYGGDSGSSGNSGYSNRERNLYDRDYEGANRSSYANSGTRLGGANYGSYGDRSRGYNDGRNEGRNYGGYSGSNYGGNFSGDYNSPGMRSRDERNWWDRTADEVSSWFGDEDAERRRNRDRQMSGKYKGKGPKNYSRSDERIKDDINDRLSDDPFVDASEIEVTVTSGEVTLTGTVDQRSAKRRAEDIAEDVSGVKNVENRIRVGQTSDYRNPETQSQGSGTATTSAQSTSPVAGSERTRSKTFAQNN